MLLHNSVHEDWLPNIIKINSFILSRKQNTINEEDNIISEKYIIDNKKTAIWGFYRLTVEEPDVLGCYAVCLGTFVPEVLKKRIAIIF
jgi:hypothetical protein